MENKKEQKGKKIVIAERDNIAAIMDGKKVTEFFVNKGDVLLGDIYLATVENILPSIEAAFVDVGVDKMGFLHAQDVVGKGALKDKLSPKQKLVVQVVKEPTGHKGPRVTTEISLPGRFLVLIPNETGINVSRKIESVKEKARLKSIVNLLKPVGVGVIVRTEAQGQSEADIQEDLEVLLEKWNNIVTSADSLTPPSLISRDQDLLYRVLREACTDDISEIVVDTAFAMNRVQQLLQNWHMSRNINVHLHKGNEPLLVATDVHKEIKAALQTKVNLPSGGYLYIQTTEALTVIDVNSGKFTSSATQDETILRTNKEAIVEIARQLRLRNIGGMIIVDFIDMTSRVDKLVIMEEFELALEPDKSKPQIGQLSDLGLVELTRHRQGQSLSELFTKKCPHCQGTGYSMEDFKFASPTAEGEYHVKAAKLKLPVSNFKKGANKPEEQAETTSTGETTENQPQQRDNKFNKNRRNNKFNKRGQDGRKAGGQAFHATENDMTEVGQALPDNKEANPSTELQPKEIKPFVFERPADAKPVEAKPVETAPEVKKEVVEEKTVSEEKKKPTRRPNRNTSKKTKSAKVEKKNESTEESS